MLNPTTGVHSVRVMRRSLWNRTLAVRAAIPALLAALVALAAGCEATREGGDSRGPEGASDFSLLVVNMDLSPGRNYLAFAVKGPDGSFLGHPEATATVSLRLLEPAGQGEGHRVLEGLVFPFVAPGTSKAGVYGARLAIPGSGKYVISARFANAGTHGLPEDGVEGLAVVAERSETPMPGDLAPRSRTRTIGSVGGDMSLLTSDPEPDPDLYRHSLDEVVGAGKPVAVMFATPLRCKSATCGPAIEQFKKAKAQYPEAIYVHVDVYEKPLDVSDETYVAAVREWRLPTEPMTFVLSPSGRVYERFEGMFLPSQLTQSLSEAASAA